MASMFVPKYQRKPNIQTKDEFFVEEAKFKIVCQYESKIKTMYNINIHFEKQPADGGRWMLMEGEPVDRRNAKNYIKAICHPVETKQVKFPASTFAEFANESTLQNIEKSTNAVIKPLKKVATFEISGTELGVTLALSQMEEIAGSLHLDPNEEQENEVENDENVIQISPLTNNASRRLATQLERALSEHSDGICSIDDYKDATPSVKRVLVNCLADNEMEDIDEDLLFDDGMGQSKYIDSKKAGAKASDRPSYIRVYSDSGGDNEDEPIEIVDTDGLREDHDTDKSVSVGLLSEKLNDTAIISDASLIRISKQQEYLRNFGLSVGYTSAKVEQALQFVDEKTRPSDFLDFLNSVKEGHSDEESAHLQDNSPSKLSESTITISDDEDDVIILETETFDMETGKGETIKHDFKETYKQKQTPYESIEIDEHQTVPANNLYKTLPEEYKDQLVLDFLQESDNSLSREELKKKNAERQRLLKETFAKQQQQGTQQPSGKKTGSKKKSKNKKKKQNQQQQQQQQQFGKEELHDKQLRLDSGGNRTYSQDEEQTCVLRVWNNSVRDNSVPLQGQGQFTVVQSPKRKQRDEASHSQIVDSKNSNSGGNPANSSHSTQNWSQPIAQRQDYRQNSPNRNKQEYRPNSPNRNIQDFRQSSPSRNKYGHWNQQQQQQHHQSAQRDNQQSNYNPVKPTQVVTPNFSGSLGLPFSQMTLPDRDDLRYIVIDGSNVAMTHGNGKIFSCKGLRICVDYFKQRGHQKITIFVPQWRQRCPGDGNMILDQNILHELKDEEVLVYTPSRKIGRKLVASYDDRFVMELAEAEDGIIVSNDQYRDLMQEKRSWRKMVEERLLMYSFVKDRFMVPNDPLGRDGPCLDDFLLKREPTVPLNHGGHGFQNHPNYGHQGHFQPGENDFPRMNHLGTNQGYQQNAFFKQPPPKQKFKQTGQKPSYTQTVHMFDELDGPVRNSGQNKAGKTTFRGGPQGHVAASKGVYTRSEQDTESLLKELKVIFPDPEQEDTIKKILANHDGEMDLMKLTNYCMCVFFT